MALLALSHTPVEHRLYEVMFVQTAAAQQPVGVFGLRRLLSLTGLRSYSSIQRGCGGLVRKLSIESVDGSDGDSQQKAAYHVYAPGEIFERRRVAGVAPYPLEIQPYENSKAFTHAIEKVVARGDLSRREALVTLCCIEGLSNAEIAGRLNIGEQTVKFHLRHIFAKFGVKRRAELVSRLLM